MRVEKMTAASGFGARLSISSKEGLLEKNEIVILQNNAAQIGTDKDLILISIDSKDSLLKLNEHKNKKHNYNVYISKLINGKTDYEIHNAKGKLPFTIINDWLVNLKKLFIKVI